MLAVNDGPDARPGRKPWRCALCVETACSLYVDILKSLVIIDRYDIDPLAVLAGQLALERAADNLSSVGGVLMVKVGSDERNLRFAFTCKCDDVSVHRAWIRQSLS